MCVCVLCTYDGGHGMHHFTALIHHFGLCRLCSKRHLHMQPSSYHSFERLCSSERPETWESTTSTFLHCHFLILSLLYPQYRLPVFAFSVLGMKSFADKTSMAACNVIMELHSCWQSQGPKTFQCPHAFSGWPKYSFAVSRTSTASLPTWLAWASCWVESMPKRITSGAARCMSAIHWSCLGLSKATSNTETIAFLLEMTARVVFSSAIPEWLIAIQYFLATGLYDINKNGNHSEMPLLFLKEKAVCSFPCQSLVSFTTLVFGST